MSFNVLIVDDSNSMRAVIKKILSISGFKLDQYFEAGDGIEALEALAGRKVLLLQVVAPGPASGLGAR